MQIIKQGAVPVMALVIGSFLFPSMGFSDGKHSHAMKNKAKASYDYDQSTSLEAQKIRKVLAAYSKAVSKGDIERMGTFFTGKSFSVVEGKHANWGWQDYRDNHLIPEFSSERFKFLDYKISNIRVGEGHMLSYAVYDFEIFYELDGEQKNKKGMGTAILESKKGDWLIRHIHTS